MYQYILIGHSLIRYAVVLFMLAAIAMALRGWLADQPWTDTHKRLNLGLVISLDIQFLLGIYLYMFLSPLPWLAFDMGLGKAMKVRTLRFWTIEHPSMMLLALVLIHIGQARSKQADEDRVKHRRAAIFFGIAALLILGSIPWPGLPVSRPLWPF